MFLTWIFFCLFYIFLLLLSTETTVLIYFTHFNNILPSYRLEHFPVTGSKPTFVCLLATVYRADVTQCVVTLCSLFLDWTKNKTQ